MPELINLYILNPLVQASALAFLESMALGKFDLGLYAGYAMILDLYISKFGCVCFSFLCCQENYCNGHADSGISSNEWRRHNRRI